MQNFFVLLLLIYVYFVNFYKVTITVNAFLQEYGDYCYLEDKTYVYFLNVTFHLTKLWKYIFKK